MKLSRTSNPILSVILPTRARVEALIDTIRSFNDLAHDRGNVEILLKVDSDDVETSAILHKLPKNVKTLIYPRMNGYHDLHLFVNDLCKISTGDWLMLFNDDARMVTQNWDIVLDQFDPWAINKDFRGSDGVCLLNPGSPESNSTLVFPMIRRQGYNAVGHYSLHPHNDTWLQYVYEPLNAKVDYPAIKMKHFNNQVSDDTRWDSVRAQQTSMNDWNEERFVSWRKQDTDVLAKLLQGAP